jgi:hypothetical protein
VTDRNENGRFMPGHSIKSPGRPKRVTEHTYLRLLSGVVSAEDWQAIVYRAVQQAVGGDARARDWLSRYLLGEKPPTLSLLTAWEETGFDPVDMYRDDFEPLPFSFSAREVMRFSDTERS